MSAITILAPELRGGDLAGRTVTDTGVVIGRYAQPVPFVDPDAERLQAALLDKRTAKPRPVLMRALAAFWRWC